MNYVLAVSGGVDSVVLLDALVIDRFSELAPDYQLPTANYQPLIAHFDHGIRPDSAEDAEWVRVLAAGYGLEYVSERVELGLGASESAARQMRYNFLRQTCKKYNALLITAHHQDDVIETMVINLIRGTGWRGLTPMAAEISDSQSPSILRPLLGVGKAQILQYAKKYQLQWREDSTNLNEKYLRNYIRHSLLPALKVKDPTAMQQLLKINQNTSELKNEIATELQKIIPDFQNELIMSRYRYIMWPSPVALEVLYVILTNLAPDWHPNSKALQQTLHFIKTGQSHKLYRPFHQLEIKLSRTQVQFKKVS
jgi:tRNA(Ile)-lysidine synthetase-like protein